MSTNFFYLIVIGTAAMGIVFTLLLMFALVKFIAEGAC